MTTYKYGWKTSYYQNTYDGKTDEEVEVDTIKDLTSDTTLVYNNDNEEDDEACDACAI